MTQLNFRKSWFIYCVINMGSKQYGVDHLNMEINRFTLERKVYHSLNQSDPASSANSNK